MASQERLKRDEYNWSLFYVYACFTIFPFLYGCTVFKLTFVLELTPKVVFPAQNITDSLRDTYLVGSKIIDSSREFEKCFRKEVTYDFDQNVLSVNQVCNTAQASRCIDVFYQNLVLDRKDLIFLQNTKKNVKECYIVDSVNETDIDVCYDVLADCFIKKNTVIDRQYVYRLAKGVKAGIVIILGVIPFLVSFIHQHNKAMRVMYSSPLRKHTAEDSLEDYKNLCRTWLYTVALPRDIEMVPLNFGEADPAAGSSGGHSGAEAGRAEAGRAEPGGAGPGGARAGGAEASGAGASGAGPGGAGASGAEASGAEASGARAGGAEASGAEASGAEASGARAGGAEASGAEASGAEASGAEPGGAGPGGAEASGAGPGGAEASGAGAGGAGPRGARAGGAEASGAEADHIAATVGNSSSLEVHENTESISRRSSIARKGSTRAKVNHSLPEVVE